MAKLRDMVGKNILALIGNVSDEMELCKLHGVEAGGVWIENQKLTEAFLGVLNARSARQTPIFFLPYHAISWIMAPSDVPALSEKMMRG